MHADQPINFDPTAPSPLTLDQLEAAGMIAEAISDLVGLRTHQAPAEGQVIRTLAGAADKFFVGLRRYLLEAVGDSDDKDQIGKALLSTAPLDGLLRLIALQATGLQFDRGLASIAHAVLVQLDPDVAANILLGFPFTLQAQVAVDIGLGPGDDAAQALSRILQRMERPNRDRILASIERYVPELADRLQGSLHRFDDVIRLDDRSIQHLLRHLDTRTLVMALRGASPAIRDRFLENLSTRAAYMIRDEIEAGTQFNQSASCQAQDKISQILGHLVEAGEINLVP